jgi:hypothetical protein
MRALTKWFIPDWLWRWRFSGRRAALLDNRLDDLFRKWYPRLGAAPLTVALSSAAVLPPGVELHQARER